MNLLVKRLALVWTLASQRWLDSRLDACLFHKHFWTVEMKAILGVFWSLVCLSPKDHWSYKGF
jgi:hypothetical protein